MWAINTIPQASVILPLGYDVTTLIPAIAHSLASTLINETPVEVFLQVLPGSTDSVNIRINPGTYRIFRGNATGLGYLNSSHGLHFSLQVTHWLNALNYGSTLSQTSHPLNPSQYSFNAATLGGFGSKNFIPRTAIQDALHEGRRRNQGSLGQSDPPLVHRAG